MKKITFMLALFMVSLCSVTAWAAEREMPTAPVTTLTSGGKYYLYNVDADVFFMIHRIEGYKTVMPVWTMCPIQAKNGSYSICIVNGEQDSYTHVQPSSESDFYNGFESWYPSGGSFSQLKEKEMSYWSIEPIDEQDGYFRIRGHKDYANKYGNYNEELFWGYIDGIPHSGATIDQQTRWQFIPANENGDRYIAELRIYNTLEDADENDISLLYYDNIYANRGNYSTEELTVFMNEILTVKKLSLIAASNKTWWNEKKEILFSSPDTYYDDDNTKVTGNYDGVAYSCWSWMNNSFQFKETAKIHNSTLNAIFFVDEPSMFFYTYDNYYNEEFNGYIDIFLDGEKIETIKQPNADLALSLQVNPGVHIVTWKFTEVGRPGIKDYGIMASTEISVNLKEPGSLGTEVLYHTDHIKNVRRLKVKGTMNDDDWAKLKMMSRLQHVDMSEAVITEIPENQFRYSGNDTTMRFLRSVVLPEGVKTIHKNSFYGSFVEKINIPTTLSLVNDHAFYGCYAKELSFPAITNFDGGDNFSNMPLLKKVILPKKCKEIPNSAFENARRLTEVIWPDSLKTISQAAFNDCILLQKFSMLNHNAQDTLALPTTVETIESYAFQNCDNLMSVKLSAVKQLGTSVFYHCDNLTSAEINADIDHLDEWVFSACPKFDELKLYSPTVVSYKSATYYAPTDNPKNITLKVPHYLVNSYKLDDYWYNAKIEGFDYSDMTYIPIRQNLTLNSERFGGKPAIIIFGGAYLKINGSDAQAFQDMKFNVNHSSALYGQLLNNSNAVTQEGELKLDYYTKAKKWYFITLPFDLDIAKITHDVAGTQYAIRSYDGATRAINGATGNWKNIDRTTTIPAGTGFIFQTNVDTWSTFFAAEGSENLAISTDEFEKTLEVNASTENSHKGWNLVGNPYQCFYNNHMLNFTAPITVWDVDKKTYAAYSITDDDYALRPNEAFFIQCPNAENNTISFPLQGRQLTSVINSQNAVKANGAAVRKLIDLTLSQNGMEDKTRVVFNDNASMAYETSCDAGKFMSMEADVPQIYTLDAESNTYAINERPFADGIVQLGIYVAKEGTCTFSAPRNSIGNVYLVDNKEGTIINLREQDYTFQSEAGTIEGRFSLCLNASGTANGIGETLENATDNGQIYDLGGRSVSKTQKGVYVVRKAGKSEKVMVK